MLTVLNVHYIADNNNDNNTNNNNNNNRIIIIVTVHVIGLLLNIDRFLKHI